jgi:hypothetical protein
MAFTSSTSRAVLSVGAGGLGCHRLVTFDRANHRRGANVTLLPGVAAPLSKPSRPNGQDPPSTRVRVFTILAVPDVDANEIESSVAPQVDVEHGLFGCLVQLETRLLAQQTEARCIQSIRLNRLGQPWVQNLGDDVERRAAGADVPERQSRPGIVDSGRLGLELDDGIADRSRVLQVETVAEACRVHRCVVGDEWAAQLHVCAQIETRVGVVVWRCVAVLLATGVEVVGLVGTGGVAGSNGGPGNKIHKRLALGCAGEEAEGQGGAQQHSGSK